MWDLLCQSRAQIEARIARGARDRFPMLTRSKPLTRSPLRRKPPKKRKGADPAYLAFLRTRPCLLCDRKAYAQASRTEAAHTGVRGLGQKAPDKEALPLCGSHHRFGDDSLHRLGRRFWTHHELDREGAIDYYQAIYTVQGGVLK